ncbi:hypothetical protein L1887_08806 [Cichorium endivia]|nr:hypothetical protein L1887_08806 [Cichorium endivia]
MELVEHSMEFHSMSSIEVVVVECKIHVHDRAPVPLHACPSPSHGRNPLNYLWPKTEAVEIETYHRYRADRNCQKWRHWRMRVVAGLWSMKIFSIAFRALAAMVPKARNRC